MIDSREILQFLHYHPFSSYDEIAHGIAFKGSDATLKREIAQQVEAGNVVVVEQARTTCYRLSFQTQLLMPFNLDTYFAVDVDDRQIQSTFNFDLIRLQLPAVQLFSDVELNQLDALQMQFRQRVLGMTGNEYRREMERFGIDFSWKSLRFEGNTYSLLETERLLKESKTMDGKTKEEAVMLLNHKDALRFVLDHLDCLKELSASHIENVHQLLTKGLSASRGLRHRHVGIAGTNYRPLDNELQIRVALRDFCNLINNKGNVFEKALLVLTLLPYIQAFPDGNNRTARIISNAILIANGYCPLSFRTVESIDYKKSMLMFYEQNNLYAFKQIFMWQFELAVKEYFLEHFNSKTCK